MNLSPKAKEAMIALKSGKPVRVDQSTASEIGRIGLSYVVDHRKDNKGTVSIALTTEGEKFREVLE